MGIAKQSVRNYDPAALRRAREVAGLSQEAVAKRAGLARSNYVVYETGRLSPAGSTLAALAAAVEVEPRALTTIAADEVTLRDLREYAGLSQQGMAERLGYKNARSYGDIESGQRALTPDLAARLAKALATNQGDIWAAWERAK